MASRSGADSSVSNRCRGPGERRERERQLTQPRSAVTLDATVVVGALVDSAELGAWCRRQLTVSELHAPHVLPAEVTSVFQRLLIRGTAQRSSLEQALDDFADLDILLHEFTPFTARVWELRDSLTASDAWYVALAEGLDAPLATLDRRLTRAPRIRCTVLSPEFRRSR